MIYDMIYDVIYVAGNIYSLSHKYITNNRNHYAMLLCICNGNALVHPLKHWQGAFFL